MVGITRRHLKCSERRRIETRIVESVSDLDTAVELVEVGSNATLAPETYTGSTSRHVSLIRLNPAETDDSPRSNVSSRRPICQGDDEPVDALASW
jgi:hypothetical protein